MPERTIVGLLLGLALAGCGGNPRGDADTAAVAQLIANALVADGTPGPARIADVRIAGDRIVEVGDLTAEPGEEVLDAGALVLAPGFIDTHSHADSGLAEHPDALIAVSQGITTVVVGQDGRSGSPLEELFAELENRGIIINVASFSGHGTLRQEVMGGDFKRPATAEEIAAMAALLAADMEAGALGLGTGLEYDPGIYSTTDEVLALARIAARHGGRYTSHLRSEDRYFWEAVEEILRIGREARIPVQISHMKLAMRSSWGQAERLLARLDEARAEGVEVTADVYPYTFWQSSLTVLFPDRNYEDPEAAAFAVSEVSTPERMLIPQFDPEPALAGKTLAEIAALRGTDAATTLIDLIHETFAMVEKTGATEVESVIAESMVEEDVERFLQWPFTNVCTDGELAGSHPRGAGSFPRVLGRYVRERGVLSLGEAVHRMTQRAARSMGFAERGRIAPGMYADLVLFDPETVIDQATVDEPHELADGIVKVWVNGRVVYQNGQATEERPGHVLRR